MWSWWLHVESFLSKWCINVRLKLIHIFYNINTPFQPLSMYMILLFSIKTTHLEQFPNIVIYYFHQTNIGGVKTNLGICLFEFVRLFHFFSTIQVKVWGLYKSNSHLFNSKFIYLTKAFAQNPRIFHMTFMEKVN